MADAAVTAQKNHAHIAYLRHCGGVVAGAAEHAVGFDTRRGHGAFDDGDHALGTGRADGPMQDRYLGNAASFFRRRPDGFHELKTLFQAIDYCDDVLVELNDSEKLSLETTGLEVGSVQENLAYRAAFAYREAAGLKA